MPYLLLVGILEIVSGLLLSIPWLIIYVGCELDKEADLLRAIICLGSTVAGLLFGAGHGADGETLFLILSRVVNALLRLVKVPIRITYGNNVV